MSTPRPTAAESRWLRAVATDTVDQVWPWGTKPPYFREGASGSMEKLRARHRGVLDRLREKNWITTERQASGRPHKVLLTDAGREALGKAGPDRV